MKLQKILTIGASIFVISVFLVGCAEEDIDYIELGVSAKPAEPSVLWELENISDFNRIYLECGEKIVRIQRDSCIII